MAEEKKPGDKRTKTVLLVLLACLTAAGISYVGFCGWVNRMDIPPNTFISVPGGSEPLDIGGTDAKTALKKIATGTDAEGERSVTVVCDGDSVVVGTEVLRFNGEEVLAGITREFSGQPFLRKGFRYLQALSGARKTYPLTCAFRTEGENTVDAVLDGISERVDRELVESVYAVEGDAIQVTMGQEGRKLDREKAKTAILNAFLHGKTEVKLEPVVTAPARLTAEQLNDAVFVKAEAAPKDRNGNILEPVIGVSVDVERAQRLLDGAEPGKQISIPLVYTKPTYTEKEEESILFRDLLSECVTYIGGSTARLNNVTLAAKKCSGLILQPGEVFDYNKVVGERTVEAGFKAAPAYSDGKTVQEVGGGICQVSSSAYWCAVHANLEIVTRMAHRYAVGYVPDGMDATVSWGGPEFCFKNNTKHPIKIVVEVEGRNLKMQFYGTNLKGTYVQTERNQLSTTDYEVIYQADESVPVGTTKEEVTPYTGKKVEVYRCVYSKEGVLLSRTLENVSDYSHRDQVILYNPADREEPEINQGEAASPEEQG